MKRHQNETRLQRLVRRADVMSERRVRQVVMAWHALALRCAMQITRVTASLPTDRDTQDKALYRAAVAGVVLLAAIRLAEGSL